MAYVVSKSDSDMIDGLLIDSKWCEQVFDKALIYDGEMILAGSPRCDVLYGDRQEQKRKFRKGHGLSEEARIVMYAPTFREGAKNGKRFVFSEVWTIDFKRLISNLETKFGGEWYVCVRVHPQLSAMFGTYHDKEVDGRIIDESLNDDMYGLLAAMDAYITDYSSAIFEAGYARIPSFIYADDIEDYTKDRGNLYWDLSAEDRHSIPSNSEVMPDIQLELPFPVAKNNDQLEEDILAYNASNYEHKMDLFNEKIGLRYDGNASSRAADIIEKIMH